nr:MFS transporter [Neorhodopirellula pilleata]
MSSEAPSSGDVGSDSNAKPAVVPKEYLIPFALTTTCFALWGFANDFTNPLVKVYENVFIITTSQASWLQFAFYTGYFCMALPAALFIRRFSYKAAIMIGFAFYAAGALLAVPAASSASFGLFLLGSYILTYGLAFLETACNPYILAMGPQKTATQRLNLAQAFNPIGSLIGMSVATLVLAPQLQTGEFRTRLGQQNESVVKHLIVDPNAAPDATKQLPDGATVKVYSQLPDFSNEVGALDGAMPNALKGFRANDPKGFAVMQRADLDNHYSPYLQRFAAYYYNVTKKSGGPLGVINYKWKAFPENAAVLDLERSKMDSIRRPFWQTDTAISSSSWGYTQNQKYKTAGRLVDDLVDIVSKNGCLLLNVGPRADGTIPDQDREILLSIGKWLKINGEAIYESIPWTTFGEGPTGTTTGHLAESKDQPFTADDIRFTAKSDSLFVIALDWPESNRLTIKTLSDSNTDLKTIESIKLLGSDNAISWKRDANGLHVNLPEGKPCDFAYVLQVR